MSTAVDIIAQQITGNLPRLNPEIAFEVAKDIEAALQLNRHLKINSSEADCIDCGTAMRPKSVSIQERPDTVQYGTSGRCSTCYSKRQRQAQREAVAA
ncbi:MAG: hypothetical protein EOP24_27530 [Hyphomicrobiales bacterium]|nr:MAG: hypothetical protein EOP24_27530 [Hyphomicrobiales bacterium]